jgi:hypothetical protein
MIASIYGSNLEAEYEETVKSNIVLFEWIGPSLDMTSGACSVNNDTTYTRL